MKLTTEKLNKLIKEELESIEEAGKDDLDFNPEISYYKRPEEEQKVFRFIREMMRQYHPIKQKVEFTRVLTDSLTFKNTDSQSTNTTGDSGIRDTGLSKE